MSESLIRALKSEISPSSSFETYLGSSSFVGFLQMMSGLRRLWKRYISRYTWLVSLFSNEEDSSL